MDKVLCDFIKILRDPTKIDDENFSLTHNIIGVTVHLKVEIFKKCRVILFNLPHSGEKDAGVNETVLGEIENVRSESRFLQRSTFVRVVILVARSRGFVEFAHRKSAAGTSKDIFCI
jgi:hypothetical protein